MSTMTKADIKKASTAELLAFYNANSGREPVKRFADRATAEKRVRFLLDRPGDGDSPAAEPVKAAAQDAKPSKPVAQRAKKPAAQKDPVATHEKRASSISKSWKDPDTAASRSARNACKVGGEHYSSVPMAFRALKLDMKKHQRVRRQMVVNGHATFEGHRFTLVKE